MTPNEVIGLYACLTAVAISGLIVLAMWLFDLGRKWRCPMCRKKMVMVQYPPWHYRCPRCNWKADPIGKKDYWI